MTDALASYSRAATDHTHHVDAVHRSGCKAYELLPAVHLVASLAQQWIAAMHQGGVQPEHLGAYLDEFTFRFNRHSSDAPA